MNTALWIIQGIAAAMFVMAGIMKSTQSKDKLAKMAWTARKSAGTIKLIGISELLGGVGLILPMALNIMPILTVAAAAALALVMVLAAIEHAKNKEYKEIGFNVFLLLMNLFIIFGRI